MVTANFAATDAFNFKIGVRDDGIYRVDYDVLGHVGNPPQSSSLILSEKGKTLSFLLDDGGDGVFGPGDSFTFTGRHLEGEHFWFNEYSTENVYFLRSDQNKHSEPEVTTASFSTAQGNPLPVVQHLEKELLRVALPDSNDEHVDTWYWKRLTYLDRQPFRLELDAGLKPDAIRVSIAGLSQDGAAQAAGMRDHAVELMLNGKLITREEWDGQEGIVIEVDESAFAGMDMQSLTLPLILELKVPPRRQAENGALLIDLVLLNWVEIEYSPAVAEGRLTIPDRKAGRRLLVKQQQQVPLWVKPTRQGSLGSDKRQVDYLMLTHSSLLAAIEPLAAFHRQRGLRVEVVDVEDIYDEFNHGMVSPFAIRDFIHHVFLNRRAPALRYVMLAGDASWDIHSESGVMRNLVPTMHVLAHGELAASDNGFVSIVGSDWRPDVAIGRIPAVSAAELTAVVDKIIHYSESASEGDWQKRTLWVADMDDNFQSISNKLASEVSAVGLTAEPVYPELNGVSAEQNQRKLIDAINEGQLLLHFLGHGGRFVWRTGPLDYQNSSDLFTAKNVEQLVNQGKLPVVLSMTCSSGPFDHPEGGSIAETFIMLPQRGAVAVLAASWRVLGSLSFSSLLLEELTSEALTIGEAIMKAKQEEEDRSLVESYNLLGDPALILKLPGGN